MIQRINSLKLFHQLHTKHCLKQSITSSFVRNATTDRLPAPEVDQENWSEIYRLPLIRIAAAFNRLKVYQTVITAVGTPAVFALEQAGQVDPNFGEVFATLGVTGILTLTLCSIPVRNLIGFVYMNDSEDKIKVGYVDFWGRRKNQILAIDDILTPWELPSRKINVYQPVKSREDESKSYKLLNRYGVITNPQRYVSLFGDDY